jgi:hypothetical protein
MQNDKVLLFAGGLLLVVLLAALFVGMTSLIDSLRRPAHKLRTDYEALQMHFAAVTLTGLGILFALGMAMYYWTIVEPGSPQIQAGKEIFDAVKTVVPPIVTLILGYYFGSKSTRERGDSSVVDAAAPPGEPGER